MARVLLTESLFELVFQGLVSMQKSQFTAYLIITTTVGTLPLELMLPKWQFLEKLKIIIKYRLMTIEEACKNFFNVKTKADVLRDILKLLKISSCPFYRKVGKMITQLFFCKSLWPSVFNWCCISIKSMCSSRLIV